MKNTSSNTGGFTLLIILGVIGFLLILLTGIFKVVLIELNDTKNMDYYFKAQSASEAGEEIAMLKLKEKKFGYHGEDLLDDTGESVILSRDPNNQAHTFHQNKDVLFGYNIDSKTSSYTSVLESSDFQVIPLFYVEDDSTGTPITYSAQNNVYLDVASGNANDFLWNIIGDESGISGSGSFNPNTPINEKILDVGGGNRGVDVFRVTPSYVNVFLGRHPKNYLVILNAGSNDIDYTVRTSGGEAFTKPVTTVYSQAKIGEIKQNIKLEIDNSKYFDVLKYSLYNSQ